MLQDSPGLAKLQQAEEALRRVHSALVNGEDTSHAKDYEIDEAGLL